MATLNFNVAGNHTDDRPYYILDKPEGGTRWDVGEFEGDNRYRMHFPEFIPDSSEPFTGAGWFWYDHGRKSFRVIVPPSAGNAQWEAGLPPCLPPESTAADVALIYGPEAFALPLLETRGRYWWQNGNRFFLNGATGFNAYARFLYEGVDAVRPFLFQRQQLRYNAIRIWTAYNIGGIGRLVPREISDYYELIPAFNSLCAEYGQYPYWTAFAGANAETLGSTLDMVDHQYRLQDKLRNTFALLDLHNEFDNPLNAPSAFVGPNPPGDVLWSQGSSIKDTDPPLPLGRFYAWHPASLEWQRKCGKQSWDYQNNNNLWIPGADDETVRVEAGGESNPIHCHDAGQCCSFFVASGFFHSRLAKLAQPWEGVELECAAAWSQGVSTVQLDIAQEGRYVRHDPPPGYLRVYEKILGDRSQTIAPRE